MKKARFWALVLILFGLVGIVFLGFSIGGTREDSAPKLALLFVGGLFVVGVLGVGIKFLMRSDPDEDSVREESYGHVMPWVILLVGGLVISLAMRPFLIPDSFGEFGHYRGDALREARQYAQRHVGYEACEECHEEKVELHAKDAHAMVPCETCHGPGSDHVDEGGDAVMLVPEGREQCLICHRRLEARPGDFPQISWEAHFKKLGIDEPETRCIDCHDPHEPLFMDRDLRLARLHPLINRCRDCHMGVLREESTLPAQHPSIFECAYCHEAIATDFSERSHSGLGCSSCHKFFKESVYAGRIIRDTDPRFCLLCHREADFRGEGAPPRLEWPEHREDMAESQDDEQKVCTDCHRENIHLLEAEIHEQAFSDKAK